MTSVYVKVAAFAIVILSCLSLAVHPVDAADMEDHEIVYVENGETIELDLYQPYGLVCMMSNGFPQVFQADVPAWITQIVSGVQFRIYCYALPTSVGTFDISFDYYPSSDSSEVRNFSFTIEVQDPDGLAGSDSSGATDAIPVDVTYEYNGSQLVIYFDDVDTSSVVQPYFYIAVKTTGSLEAEYYLSPGYNTSYVVSELDDDLDSFVVYLVDGLPEDFSASNMVTSSNCFGSLVVSSPVKTDDSFQEPETPSDDVETEIVPDDPSDLLVYGILAIAALFGIAIIFGRRG